MLGLGPSACSGFNTKLEHSILFDKEKEPIFILIFRTEINGKKYRLYAL
jgi:hypothetical protein